MSTKSKTPSFIAWHVEQYGEGKSEARWTRIGATWPNQDGKGHNLDLKLMPLDGHIVLRVYEPKEDAAE